MQLHSIETGNFKLDGGAMFGVVPKSIWNKLNPADENNLCTWALRCLLIIDGDRKILVDTGMGSKQDEKFFSHYHPSNTITLKDALAKINVSCAEITDVLLTHLHFDHVGGAIAGLCGNPALCNLVFHTLNKGHGHMTRHVTHVNVKCSTFWRTLHTIDNDTIF